MKRKFIILYLLCFFCVLSFAHTINYDKVMLRHWTVTKENNSIDGSFYMLKDGNVFIEDADDNIIQYPLSSLSKDDQKFALKKAAWVNDLNAKLLAQTNQPIKTASTYNYRYLLVAFILVFFGWYLLRFASREKLKYFVPVLSVGVIMTLASFSGSVFKILPSITDPLFVDSAFTPFKPNVFTHWDSTYFYVESKGIPTTHAMMTGISNWQQQVPIPQCYSGNNAWQIPLNPVLATTPVPVNQQHFLKGAVAVAVNGIPIFNPYTNTGADAYLTGQLDNWGGHCGRADDYHYHIAPLSLYGFTAVTSPIAFALDGFAVYGVYEPDGSPMASLDGNHGHFGTNGVYHYHGTASAPYMIGNMVGVVTEDNTLQIIPQPHANPVRGAQSPLLNAAIDSCIPNGINNGYTLYYHINSQHYSTEYHWNAGNPYTYHFHFIANNGISDSTYNGFTQCVVPVGINEINSAEDILAVYPNPANAVFYLQLKNSLLESDVKQILIYDLKGNLMYKTDSFTSQIAVNDFSRGCYLLKIQFENYQLTKKVFMQ